MVDELKKMSYGRVIAAGFLAGLCGFAGGEAAVLKSAVLGVGISAAFVTVERYIAGGKYDKIWFCALLGVLFCIPISLLNLNSFIFSSNEINLPEHIGYTAPLVYGFLFMLGASLKRKLKADCFAGFNIIYGLMFLGGIYRLYLLMTDQSIFMGAIIGALATVTTFTMTIFVCLYADTPLYKIKEKALKKKLFLLAAEFAVLLFFTFWAAIDYGQNVGEWLFHTGQDNPEVMNELNTPYYLNSEINIKGREYKINHWVAKSMDYSSNGISVPDKMFSKEGSSSTPYHLLEAKVSPDKSMVALYYARERYDLLGRIYIYGYPGWKLIRELSGNIRRQFCWTDNNKLIVQYAKDDEIVPELFLVDPKTEVKSEFANGSLPSQAPSTGRIIYQRDYVIYAKKPGGIETGIGRLNKRGNRLRNSRYASCEKMAVSPDERFILFNHSANKWRGWRCYYLIKDLRNGKEHIVSFNWAGPYSHFRWLTPEVAQRAINNKLTEEKK